MPRALGDPSWARGYRMAQGGRLLVIFSSGSPFLALRIASISWGDRGEGVVLRAGLAARSGGGRSRGERLDAAVEVRQPRRGRSSGSRPPLSPHKQRLGLAP